ncbi:MAG: zinc-ribbon domain-containing protein [Myxococcota bacterium]
MIAACPQCQTRFRLAREKLGPQGARIRCSSCQTVFRVQAPEPGSPPTPAEARPSPVAQPPAPRPAPAPPALAKPLPPLARAIVAEPDADLAKSVADLLTRWRIAPEIVEDGGSALLQMFRSPPQIVVLGAGLASLSAPKLAEIAKRSGELAGVKVVHVVIASEPPVSGYEADEALEPADLPGGLSPLLAKWGLGAKPATAAAPAPAPVRAPAPAPAAAAPTAARSTRPVPSSDPDIAAAERLARIAVSDVILYNEAKFAAAIAAGGNVAKALASELEEARQHFNSRVSPILRHSRDFLKEELERRAAQRKT